MAANILRNFITKKIRQGDVYLPATIFLFLKNNGKATKTQIAKLLYIFENKHSLEKYELIVENFVYTLLSEYSLIARDGDLFILNSWPLEEKEIDELIRLCYKVSDGFFRNLPHQQKKAA